MGSKIFIILSVFLGCGVQPEKNAINNSEMNNSTDKLSIDSLKEYSYLLFVHNSGNTDQGYLGTGFFVSIDSKLFLITAGHNISGYQYGKPTWPEKYNSLGIRYFIGDKAALYTLPIDHLFDELKKEKGPDFVILPIPEFPVPVKAFNLDNLTDTAKSDSAAYWGFPANHPDLYSKRFEIEALNEKGKKVEPDEDTKTKEHWDEHYYFSSKGGPGFSGSPVFYFSEDQKVLGFAGVVVASHALKTEMAAVKAEYVLNVIRKYLELK